MEKKAKRRPGREQTESHEEQTSDVKVVDVETGETTGGDAVHQGAPLHEQSTEASFSSGEHPHQGDKIEIKFAGSELIRAKFPKPFAVAETIATDWVHDGRFEDLPLGHPLAQYFAAKGLRKAKEMEKKVLESPVTEKIAMQALTAGMKAQEIISQVRSKMKK
jgi:hypothetical protein